MNFFERELVHRINDCQSLFLKKVVDNNEEYRLHIVVKEGIAKDSNDENNTSSKEFGNDDETMNAERIMNVLNTLDYVESDKSCDTFSLIFDDYDTYSVTREIFSPPHENDVYQGRHLRIYSNSRFLDHSQEFMHDFFGNLDAQRHYAIVCNWHVIDIMSPSEPRIYLGEVEISEQDNSSRPKVYRMKP